MPQERRQLSHPQYREDHVVVKLIDESKSLFLAVIGLDNVRAPLLRPLET